MYCFYSSCKVCCPIYLNETRFNIPTLEEYVNIKAIVKGACLIFQHWTELWLKPFDQNHIKQIVLLLQWISVFWGGKWGTKTLSFNSHGEKLMLKRIHDHSSLFCSTFLIQNLVAFSVVFVPHLSFEPTVKAWFHLAIMENVLFVNVFLIKVKQNVKNKLNVLFLREPVHYLVPGKCNCFTSQYLCKYSGGFIAE